jgi:serine phosphatase RsbU (regulator of sigma subunit)/CHASE2 domain-containing sensor protein
MRRSGALAALVAAIFLLAMGDALRRPLFDGWQRLSPRDLADTRVRVVLIDAESLKALGPWPWSRFHLARLTDEIAKRGAVAIGYDVLFAEPDRLGPRQIAGLYPELPQRAIAALPSPDQVFAQIIGEAPVVLARTGSAEEGKALPPSSDADLPPRLPSFFPHFERAVTAIPELDDVAAGHGLINAQPWADGVYRGVPLLARVGSTTAPGLALELARVATKADTVGLDGHAVVLGHRRLPVDGRGEMRLRFGHFPANRMVSAVDLIRHNPTLSLKGAAVLIGPAATGTVDVAATPIDTALYGVLVQAQALDAILRGSGWLERPRWARAAEWGAAVALVLLALWLVPGRGRASLLVPFASGALLAIAWLLFDRGGLLLDPIPQVVLSSATAIGIGLSAAAQTMRDRERLRETLIEERVSAAANEAELAAARSIQQSMLPRPEQLATLDPRVEVAALLEPARSVGGDFFDVVRLDEDRIAFAVADVAGKGMFAALFMALSKALAKSAMLRTPLPELAATIQTELSRDAPDEMALTMLIGVLDLATGETHLINAGHEDPLVVRADGRVEELRMEGGPPFCFADYPWPIEPVQLVRGDMLLIFTDGLTEAQDPAGRFHGRARLESVLSSERSPRASIEAVVSDVRAFEAGGQAADDLTLMAIRYLG